MHQISEDRRVLTLLVDAEAQKELQELRAEDPDYFRTDRACAEFLESLLANSGLDWIDPEDTDDLTDAPMLGFRGGDADVTRDQRGPYGATYYGGDAQGPLYAPILERWAFMDYALRPMLEDLADSGKVELVAW